MGQRRHYQQESDLDREVQTLDVIIRYMNEDTDVLWDWEKLPETRYVIDAGLHQRKWFKKWVEVKGRRGDPFEPKRIRDTWFIGLSKVIAGLELYRYTGLPFYIAYVWTTRVFIGQIEKIPPNSIEWNGNLERDDEGDREPVVHFPNTWFHEIGKIANGNWKSG